MKLLELTDFFSKTKKEYVVVERIIRFEPLTRQYVRIEKEEVIEPRATTVMDKVIFLKPFPVKKYVEKKTIVDRNGSMVILSEGAKTMVLETPEQIRNLLTAGNFVEIKGV